MKEEDEITEEVPAVEDEAPEEVTPDPTPGEEVDLEVIVDQVLRGEWGVGQDRRLRLSLAGHDANAVQREIVRRANKR